MRAPLSGVDPVAILLDAVNPEATHFTGIDLDSGKRVRVTIQRDLGRPPAAPGRPGKSLILVLTLETLEALQ